jgi:F-type H+-transporting ATPase subunit epsilon
MNETLRLEVVTPQRVMVEAEVATVEMPGSLGELGVLPGHTPLLTSLATGELRYRTAKGVEIMVVQGGFAEVMPDRVTVLADLAEWPKDVDVETARRERDEIQSAMKVASAEQIDELTSRLRLAETRIAVAGA